LSKVESLKKISKWSLRQKSFRSKNKWLITSSKVRLGLLKANKYWPFKGLRFRRSDQSKEYFRWSD
jgi:hypothetical protein